MIDEPVSPYGEDAHGRVSGNMQPGPADFQLDERHSREIQGRAAEMEKQMVGEGCTESVRVRR